MNLGDRKARAMRAGRADELLSFVEDIGLFYERTGLPRMAGRVLGWLLICEPPEQSMQQLGDAVGGSKGSMSTMTRMLIQMGLIERARLPGSRRDQFRIRPGMWTESMRDQLMAVRDVERLLQRGLTLVADRTPASRERLEEARALYAWFGQELPKLLDRWEKTRHPGQRLARSRG